MHLHNGQTFLHLHIAAQSTKSHFDSDPLRFTYLYLYSRRASGQVLKTGILNQSAVDLYRQT